MTRKTKTVVMTVPRLRQCDAGNADGLRCQSDENHTRPHVTYDKTLDAPDWWT